MDSSYIVVTPSAKRQYERFHFASAVRAGELLLCSGQIGLDERGRAIADPEAQFTRAFELVREVLEQAGVGFGDVVELTTYHVGLMQHIGAFMAVKDRFLSEPYPAWTAIGVSELAAPGGLVEIRAIARLPRAKPRRAPRRRQARRSGRAKTSKRPTRPRIATPSWRAKSAQT
jgi:enamine deaminase RidA (YjgF/YER057c/UK114 family)